MQINRIENEIDLLINGLKAPDWRRRKETIDRFFSLQDETLIESLANRIQNQPLLTQLYFCRLLARFTENKVITLLIQFLNSGRAHLQEEAAIALDKIEDEKKYDQLISLLEVGKDNFAQIYAIRALGKARQGSAVMPLLEKLQTSSEPNIRVEVIDALRLIDDQRAIKMIGRCLDDANENIDVLAAAIFAIVDFRAEEFRPQIISLLSNASAWVRRISAWALGELRYNNRAIVRLRERLTVERDLLLREEILRSLIKLKVPLEEGYLTEKDTGLKALVNANLKGEELISDICLIVEGTYPYVSGGVATWIHELIEGFPQYTFSILHIGSSRKKLSNFKYRLPANVIGLFETYIFEGWLERKKIRKKKDEKAWRELTELVKEGRWNDFEQLLLCFMKVDNITLLTSPQIWNLLVRIYKERLPEEASFPDFFWTYRSIILPLLQLKDAPLPHAHLYHATSTGYAGVLGALAKKKLDTRLLLTEHGIYHRERRMEIEKLPWIYSSEEENTKIRFDLEMFRNIWIKTFEFMSKLSYHFADKIVTLYEDNRQCQIEMGAPAAKTMIIPNGIRLERFDFCKEGYVLGKEEDVFQVGLVGRVVPIKDIKTFIKACRIVADNIPRSEFLIMGPLDEEPTYVEECKLLAKFLQFGERMHFTGKVDLTEYYPKLDVIVLTSVSESQPMVILEAMARGLPVVATNVGSCQELLYGANTDDKRLGQAGIVTTPGNFNETARAILKIYTNDEFRQQISRVGRKRVEKYYRQEDLIRKYESLYRQYLNSTG